MALPSINLPPLSAARPEEILLPPKPWFVLLTLLAALVLNLLPWSGVWLALKPDFLALVLLYWCIQQPRLVGVGTAWSCGLLMDVGQGALFGQHALAYALLGFAAEYFHRRVLRFPLWQQAAHVAVVGVSDRRDTGCNAIPRSPVPDISACAPEQFEDPTE